MTPYQDIIQVVIKKYIDVVGPRIAVSRARQIKALDIADDGNVKALHDDGPKTLEVLHDIYTDLLGSASKTFTRSAIDSIRDKYKDITLPGYLA